MISKALVSPFRAFIALVVITSSVTSSIDASAAIAPPPSRFARDLSLRLDSALVTVRSNEARDDASDQARINSCTSLSTDFDCLFNQGGLGECEATYDPNSQHAELIRCLQNVCPDTSPQVVACVGNSNKEAAILDPCTANTLGQTTSDDIACLRINFDSCSANSNTSSQPNGANFGSCMSHSCPTVNNAVITCISNAFVATG